MCIDFSPVADLMLQFYTLEEFDEWLDTPQPILDGKTPCKCIADGDMQRVVDVAAQLADGNFL